MSKFKTLERQVGGIHYKNFSIEPLEFNLRNGLDFATGNVIKYVCRAPFKNGLDDLRKAQHYLEVLIEKAEQELAEESAFKHTPSEFEYSECPTCGESYVHQL